ncbi:MAG: ATP-dependent RecD-like DNA helicase [Muribaculaceae bacterium]
MTPTDHNHDPRDGAVERFAVEVMNNLPYEPNDDQIMLIAQFGRFLFSNCSDAVFLLGGYAGTGKTSITGAIVQTLTEHNVKSLLLAPTGRAAKVFTEYSHHTAYTIHRKIYRQKAYGTEGFGIADNRHTNMLFIVDEASMISNTPGDNSFFGTGRLLDDLIHYVYSGEGCRLVLIGDRAQLPPVGQTDSPALSKAVLQSYGLTVFDAFLADTRRQSAHSGILHNATLLREMMADERLQKPVLHFSDHDDIQSISSEFLLEEISDCYGRDGLNETIVVTRSNKRATMFNLGIRNQILYREDELVSGDMLLVSKNNYFWSEDYNEIDFIANGDVMRVVRVRGEVETRYGLRFANVTVEFPDHNHLEMDVKIVLDALVSDAPALSRAQSERFFCDVMDELEGTKSTRFKALKKHPYFNALQVKYAYTVTCHKAQGGQWQNVFIDMGYIADEAFEQLDFFRWLYTAISRARKHVYLINCPLEST